MDIAIPLTMLVEFFISHAHAAPVDCSHQSIAEPRPPAGSKNVRFVDGSRRLSRRAPRTPLLELAPHRSSRRKPGSDATRRRWQHGGNCGKTYWNPGHRPCDERGGSVACGLPVSTPHARTWCGHQDRQSSKAARRRCRLLRGMQRTAEDGTNRVAPIRRSTEIYHLSPYPLRGSPRLLPPSFHRVLRKVGATRARLNFRWPGSDRLSPHAGARETKAKGHAVPGWCTLRGGSLQPLQSGEEGHGGHAYRHHLSG